jgi:hypothetical protein
MRLPMALTLAASYAFPTRPDHPAPHHRAPINQYRDGDALAPMGKGLDSQKNPPPDHLHNAPLDTPSNKSINKAATSD